MAADPAKDKVWTPEEYLALERMSEARHEYAAGEIFAMSGASRAHNLIVANLVGEIRAALKSRPCETYPSDMRVWLPTLSKCVYPDLAIVCGEPRFQDDQFDTLLNPSAIVEVLSPADYDRGEKWEGYRAIDSLAAYVLVDSRRRHVEIHSREPDGWKLRDVTAGGAIEIAAIGVSLAWDEVYARTEPLLAG